jgi:hypothetical protein
MNVSGLITFLSGLMLLFSVAGCSRILQGTPLRPETLLSPARYRCLPGSLRPIRRLYFFLVPGFYKVFARKHAGEHFKIKQSFRALIGRPSRRAEMQSRVATPASPKRLCAGRSVKKFSLFAHPLAKKAITYQRACRGAGDAWKIVLRSRSFFRISLSCHRMTLKPFTLPFPEFRII